MVRLADAIREYSDKSAGKTRSDLFSAGDKSNILKTLSSDRYENMAITKEATPHISINPQQIYNQLIAAMQEIGRAIRNGAELNTEHLEELIYTVIRNANEILDDLHSHALLSTGSGKYTLAIHAANVCINSAILGVSLRYSKQQLLELGTAALFHDLGMYKLSDTLLKGNAKLTPSEREVIRKHPEVSYNELLKRGEHYRWVADIVYQEHERMDGSGYPRGLKGDEIHEYASIIGIVDIYEGLIHKGLHREKLLPSHAMKEIIRNSKGLFPTAIIKTLVNQLSMFPVKSFVRLNNGSTGMVIKANSFWPLKPIIALLNDAQGKKVTGNVVVDLAESRLLYIEDVIDENDIPDVS